MTARSYSTRLRDRRRRHGLLAATVFLGLFVLIAAVFPDRDPGPDCVNRAGWVECRDSRQ